MRRALFWSATGTLVYTYGLFPALVALRGVVRPRAYRTDDVEPSVSVVLAAHNEAASIAAKVENLLALDYPSDRLEIVIASDGSEDGTNDIVRAYEDPRLRLLALPRCGKAATLNAAVAAATGEVLVFSDANSMYAPDAVRALLRPLADPTVGGVAGNQRYLSEGSGEGIAAGEERYWSLDRLLKLAESRAGNVISATGAIYAVRRTLFRPIPEGVTDDFVTSTSVIAQGRRLVFAADAVAFEPVAASGGIEFGRKVRVMTRGLRGVLVMRELLDPRRHGFYALQLLSHKVLRRLMVFPLLVLATTSPSLWQRSRLYRAATLAQAVLYACGAAGLAGARTPLGRHKALAVPAFFCMVNAASLHAVWNLLRGHRIDRWEPRRTLASPQADREPEPADEASELGLRWPGSSLR